MSATSKPFKYSVTFHMAKFTASNQIGGPLFVDGAPYSGVGIQELNLSSPHLGAGWNERVQPFPETLSDRTY